ncbi:hypothetical protein, partial [Escherichia coli]|uniref:hypothetical protein n=1 Tax=Escherichia coli TaxID=562 RepID=UPI00287A4E91
MGIRGASYSEYHLVLVYNLLLGGFFGLSAGNSRGNCRFARINLFFWYRISLLLFQLACFGACNSRFDGSFARINLFFWLRISRLLFPRALARAIAASTAALRGSTCCSGSALACCCS